MAQWNQQQQQQPASLSSITHDAIAYPHPPPPPPQQALPFPLLNFPPLPPAAAAAAGDDSMSWQQQQQQQQGPPPPPPHAPTYAGVVVSRKNTSSISRWGSKLSEGLPAAAELGDGDDDPPAAPTNAGGKKRQPPESQNIQQPKKAKKEPPASHNKNGKQNKKGAKKQLTKEQQEKKLARSERKRKRREEAALQRASAGFGVLAQALLGGRHSGPAAAAAAADKDGTVTSRHNGGEASASSRPLSKTLPKSVLTSLPLQRQDEIIEEELSSLTDDLVLALRNNSDNHDAARSRIRECRNQILACHQRLRTRPLFPTERERRTARVLKQAAAALGEEEPVVAAATAAGSSQDDNKSSTEAVSTKNNGTEREQRSAHASKQAAVIALGEQPQAAADGGERRDDNQSATASRSSETKAVSATTTKKKSNGTGLLNNVADKPSGKEAVSTVAAEIGGGKTNTTLSEARAKLRKAMLAKKKALEEQLAAQTRQVNPDPLRPINALMKGGLDTLRITQIRTSGPAEKVFFAETALLDADENLSGTTGEDAAAAAAAADNNGEGTARASNKNLAESLALTARKVQLQQRLVEAKEKRQRLEEAAVAAHKPQHRPQLPPTVGPKDCPETGGVQQNEGNAKLDQQCVVQGLAASSAVEQTQPPPSKTLTREELLKRKEEAQRTNAVSHLRHILLKQERLKAEQASDMQQTAANLASCETELSASKKQLEETKQNIQTLAARKEVLDALTAKHVSELVKKRKSLHDYKVMRAAAVVGAELACPSVVITVLFYSVSGRHGLCSVCLAFLLCLSLFLSLVGLTTDRHNCFAFSFSLRARGQL